MKKELGKNISRNKIKKIASDFHITYHAYTRLLQRFSNCGNNMSELVGNVAYDLSSCLYAYNNDDGSITAVVKGDYAYILTFNDKYKQWNIITYKEPSENNISNREKHDLSKYRTLDRSRWKREIREDKKYRFNDKIKKTRPYKRDKNWKGEEW